MRGLRNLTRKQLYRMLNDVLWSDSVIEEADDENDISFKYPAEK